MKKTLLIILLLVLELISPKSISAAPAIGIHLLDTHELTQAKDLVAGSPNHPGVVTVVLRSDDRNLSKWQHFFDLAAAHNIVPIVRLATSTQNNGWKKPVKKDIIQHAQFLSFLNWHQDSLTVVAFNEPNHAAEWGGEVNPQEYAHMLNFTLNWFHTEAKNYDILPAGLDAAAPNSVSTMDSLQFIRSMLAAQPEIIHRINGWVSHSYPNPGFSGSPSDTHKASIRGFQHELDLLAQYTGRRFDVYITETGWRSTPQTQDKLAGYYQQALENVWNDDQIKAITPFVFSAASGPFQEFSFLNSDGTPTPQYHAWKSFIPQYQSKFSHLLSQR